MFSYVKKDSSLISIRIEDIVQLNIIERGYIDLNNIEILINQQLRGGN